MDSSKTYDPQIYEPKIQDIWEKEAIYHFSENDPRPVYSIDTPPPTVSGNLHLGHVFSYSHADFIARFKRMQGYNVYYPMGYDDNGLPTEKLVERIHNISAKETERMEFIAKCNLVSNRTIEEYANLWRRMGLSVDWRYTYSTIDESSRRISQWSFIDLCQKGLTYRQDAPSIWCPGCQTAIAQADVIDQEIESEFVTIQFPLEDQHTIAIATTRPELLPACVAIFVHPKDTRYTRLIGRNAAVPIFGQQVPVEADERADPLIGTGCVMCCTFGDATDVIWWHTHKLPLIEAITQDGKMTSVCGEFAGLTVGEARVAIKSTLLEQGWLTESHPTRHNVGTHERCDTPVEYRISKQWFIRVLEHKDTLLELGERVNWYPTHMKSRYRTWVQNLNWDWCISRQRFYGVPFPVWYCQECGRAKYAQPEHLPVDPIKDQPDSACQCGSWDYTPDPDVMDTWATSSMSPQICSQWMDNDALHSQVFPMTLRPQAHEIIRTWAFYTLVKSHYHFEAQPWQDVLISGWGVAGEGMGKISKSRGGGPISPMETVSLYSADAVRYWAASTGPGKDAIISEEKIINGGKLITKLWNIARFSAQFLADYRPLDEQPVLTPADRWIRSRVENLIERSTHHLERYEYAIVKNDVEIFFWRDLADNYLEMVKQRLYDSASPTHEGARNTLYRTLWVVTHLLAPYMPHICEHLYQHIFKGSSDPASIHLSSWPIPEEDFQDEHWLIIGEILVEIATAVRRFKSTNKISLGTPLTRLLIRAQEIEESLTPAIPDLMSITRAREISFVSEFDSDVKPITLDVDRLIQVVVIN